MEKKKTTSDENRMIVELIVKRNLLDNIIKQVTNNSGDPDLYDLRQDLLFSLLVDDKLSTIYENNQLNFYLARIVMNNIASKTSPYYRIYKRPRLLSEPISKNVLNIQDE